MGQATLILLVDDNDKNRNILAKLIDSLGYTALQAADSSQALNLIHQHKPQLMLMDMLMPVADSMQLLTTIRADTRLQHMAVMLISDIADLNNADPYIEAGADDFIPRPFNSILLKLKINRALAHQQQLQQARNNVSREFTHALNNQLATIMLNSELLLMDTQSDQREASLNDIMSSAEQASAIIKAHQQDV